MLKIGTTCCIENGICHQGQVTESNIRVCKSQFRSWAVHKDIDMIHNKSGTEGHLYKPIKWDEN